MLPELTVLTVVAPGGLPHLGMLGGARFGRLGAWGLSALLKGPRGPGRLGGGGAPRGAGRWPEDILLEAVGLGGGDLQRWRTCTVSNIVWSGGGHVLLVTSSFSSPVSRSVDSCFE